MTALARAPLAPRLAPPAARPLHRSGEAMARVREVGAALRRAEVLSLPIGVFALGFLIAFAL